MTFPPSRPSTFQGLLPLKLSRKVSPPPRRSSYVALPINEKEADELPIADSIQRQKQGRQEWESSTCSDPAFPTSQMSVLLPTPSQVKAHFIKRPKLLAFMLLSLLSLSFVSVYQRYENKGGPTFQWWSSGPLTFQTSTSSSSSSRYDTHSSATRDHVIPTRPIWVESHRAMFEAGHLVDWIASGEVQKDLDLSAHSRVDGLWTWVNGSDPRHNLARQFYAKDPTRVVLPPDDQLSQLSPSSSSSTLAHPFSALREMFIPSVNNEKLQNTDSRFRDNGELLYSLRSARMYLENLGTMHVLSTDFWESGRPEGKRMTEPSHGYGTMKRDIEFSRNELTEQRSDRFFIEGDWQRLGQVPQWLDVDHQEVVTGQAAVDYRSSASKNPPGLILHHDWNTFRPLRSVDPVTQALPKETRDEADMLAWKLAHLPTFNSMAAEAFLGVGIPGLSELFTASSDDMALGRPVSPSDFGSPLYGPVLHINHQLSIYPQEKPWAALGEAPSHRYSAWLLSERFGFRSSHYIVHIQKAHLTPLMLETRLIWGDEFAQTSGKRFRGDGIAVNSHMLSYGMNIERHREALLWSFFMLKVDLNADNHISDSELHSAKLMMSWDGVDTKEDIKVAFPQRLSAAVSEVQSSFLSSNFPRPLASEYEFTSMDGYAYAFNQQRGSRQWPLFYEKEDEGDKERFNKASCTLKLKQCVNDERNAEALFKSFAFQQVGCGDCLITHLVAQSGPKGLSAFLPEAKSSTSYNASFPQVETSVDREEVPPHLPLDKKWRSADFTVQTVVKRTGFSEGNKRDFASLLISRYSYAIASAPASFVMMRNPAGLEAALRKLDSEEVAFMCFNDDITSGREEAISRLGDWYRRRFDQKLDFEL